MRTILSSPVGYEQFAAVPLVTTAPPNGRGPFALRRAEKVAPCGCTWRGLVSGGGYSDGQVSFCDAHAGADDE